MFRSQTLTTLRSCSGVMLAVAFAFVSASADVRQASAASLLVEAESFKKHGGWKLDTQFIEIMGSPYLLAHGMGDPVADATTTVSFPATGTYKVYVRTKDWVARWKAPGQPGRFQLLVNGKALGETFGTKGESWHWHEGGTITIDKTEVALTLKDLTGFAGRCDAIYFTSDGDTPPNTNDIKGTWRKKKLGLPADPIKHDGYDLVVIGGGYSGLGASISAARMGIKVALIQNRGVLGGNGSSEVRVWAKGNIRRGKYPRIGEIIEEIADSASKSPGTYEEFEDAKKEKIVRAEKNIDLFLFHHAHKVEMDKGRIKAVSAFDTRSGAIKRFTGRFFVDATGHGTIGHLAGADYDMTLKGHMGMSNMWIWKDTGKPVAFGPVPWALNLEMQDFPYPRRGHGEWFWETGFDKHPLHDLEYMRDWNFRAVYGAWNAIKNRGGAKDHANAKLVWLAYIGGPRESRRLLGDVVLTQEDIVSKKQFPDGTVPSTWSIDLHYPKKQYMKKYPDDPFIAVAVHGRGVDRRYGYPIPYRSFYSRNIPNLFMAGRCISVTHEALGTVRVMKTCGMMGEVVGKAAMLCVKHDVQPADIYPSYWKEMDELLQLPGVARRQNLRGDLEIKDPLPLAGSGGPATGLDPAKLPGVVIDDEKAKLSGSWGGPGTGLKGYVGFGYRYAGGGTPATATFTHKVAKDGRYDIRYAYQPHPNRASNASISVHAGEQRKTHTINMRVKAPLKDGFVSLGVIELKAGQTVTVVATTKGANGNVHVDAVQILPAK